MSGLLRFLVLIVAVGVVDGWAGTFVSFGSQWRYWPGTEAPSEEPEGWAAPEFDDGEWERGRAPFRYGDGAGGTVINGMRNNYSTFFLRQEFNVAELESIAGMELSIDYDDGFVVWLNGVEVLRANAPTNLALDGFAPANHESGSAEVFSLDASVSRLVDGRNVIAIQGFNTNLTSSDFMLHPELTFRGPDRVPPTVVAVEPPPGVLDAFETISITFSEPVRGVDASDLALNGRSALRMTQTGNTYTFTFAVPEPGDLTVAWQQDAAIEDFANTPNPFDWQANSEIRRYQVVDADAPFVTRIHPPRGQQLADLQWVQVYFSEPVVGVEATDLEMNGVAALGVHGVGAGPYEFRFESPESGQQSLSFVAEHGIEDFAAEPNPLAVTTWEYAVAPETRYEGIEISEIMAANQTGLMDEDQERVDWIELHNTTDQTVNLEGWALSDEADQPGKWVFGDFRLRAGEYRIVFASAKDRAAVSVRRSPHTNFRLSRVGENIGLWSPELPRRLVSQLGESYPEQRNDHSYGKRLSGEMGYFMEPSPGEPNGEDVAVGLLPKPRFSAQRGFYDRPFDLVLSSPVEGAVIRYTLDQSEPTSENGQIYRGPISITKSEIVRAAVFRPGQLPSETVTHSYLYRLASSRRSLPILSLVTDETNLFGSTGIMETRPRNTTKRGRQWERPVSVEYFLPDGTSEFQVDCGLRIQGGNYVRERYSPRGGLPFSKYSFRLYFRGDYGTKSLEYPLIPRSPVAEFKQIVLRAGMNDHSNPFVVDELVRRLSADMGQVASQGTLVNLYVNGVYEGYYNPTERIDEDFLDSWEGGAGDYDIIAQFGEVRAGTTASWNRLKTTLRRDLTEPANYQAATELLDIDNFIDYLLVNIYAGTRDWPHNNWRAARERVPGALWRFYAWDAEWAFYNVGGNVRHNTLKQELNGNPDIARFYQALVKNPTFRTRFADRVHRHFFGDGALTNDHVRARFEELRQSMSGVLRNMARNIGTTWSNQRRSHVLGFLADEGLFLEDNVPQFSRTSGAIAESGLEMSTGGGEIYYTMDGSDPYLPPRIAADRTEIVRERSRRKVWVPTEADAGTAWRQELADYDDGNWLSGSGGIGYDNNATYRGHFRIDVAESMQGKNTSIYIRIPFRFDPEQLPGVNVMNLHMKFDDGFVAFINGKRVAAANAPSTLRWNSSASGDNPDASAVNFQVFNVSQFLPDLIDGTNILAIHGLNANITSSDFLIDARLEVGVAASGTISEKAIRYAGPINVRDVTQIRARSLENGLWSAVQEGVFYPVRLEGTVKLTELMYHPPGGDEFEFVELSNLSPVAVDLSRYVFQGITYEFPVGSRIEPGQALVLASGRNPTAFQQRYPELAVFGHFGGRLSNAGETIALEDSRGNVVTSVRYDDEGVWPESADGMGDSLELLDPQQNEGIPTHWWRSEVPGGTPGSLPSASSGGALVISEIAANTNSIQAPGDGRLDWIELENRGATSVSLAGYRLRDDSSGSEFVFGESASLGAGERLVIDQSEEDTTGRRLPFGLNREGDAIILIDASGNRVDGVTFGAQPAGYTLIRQLDGSWTLGLPTPAAVNQVAQLADPASLKLNEIMANPAPGEPDWVELVNLDPERPLSLTRLTFERDDRAVLLGANSYLSPGGYLLLESDAGRGSAQLGARLPALGATIRLLDEAGVVLDELSYSAQEEGSSLGRLPNGTGRLQTFVMNPTPGEPNREVNPSLVRIHELMARNQSLTYEGIPGTPDWLELLNESSNSVDLSGYQLLVSGDSGWTFPAGTSIGAGEALTVWFDGDDLVSRVDSTLLVVGQALPGRGASVSLLDASGQVMDRLSYGPQLANRSIGRIGSSWRLQLEPTPGQLTAEAIGLGSSNDIVINEYRSSGEGDDWIELYNGSGLPVDLTGLALTDDPSLAGTSKHVIAPLTFVDAWSWVVFSADGNPDRGANHLSFRLDTKGETLRLVSQRGTIMDEVLVLGSEDRSESAGRFPDGSETWTTFASAERSPGRTNHRLINGLMLNEVMLAAAPPFEAAIELHNATDQSFDLSNWLLGWSDQWPQSVRIPFGTRVEPNGFAVVYDSEVMGVGGNGLSSIVSEHPSRLYLAEVDEVGNPTGRRVELPLTASQSGESIGRISGAAEGGVERLTTPSFGVDGPRSIVEFRSGDGQLNAPARVGAVVVSEIHFGELESPALSGVPSSTYEYVEVVNRSPESVALSSASDRTVGWRLVGGIEFEFEGDVALEPGGALVLVSFDPGTESNQVAAFKAAYPGAGDAWIIGPYAGRLGNEGDEVRLEQLGRISAPGLTAGGELMWLVEDRVRYDSKSPWPVLTPDSRQSLQRVAFAGYGNDPGNWRSGAPDPGAGAVDGGELLGGIVISQVRLSQGQVAIRFRSQSAGVYRVEFANTLIEPVWQELSTVQGEDGEIEVIDESPNPFRRFYRVVTP